MVNALVRTIVAIPLFLLLVITSWVMGMIVPPIASEVLSRQAVQEVGFAAGLDVILKVGLRWGLPVLGLVIGLWWVFGGLGRDVRDQRRARR